jgi:hypothetical protein
MGFLAAFAALDCVLARFDFLLEVATRIGVVAGIVERALVDFVAYPKSPVSPVSVGWNGSSPGVASGAGKSTSGVGLGNSVGTGSGWPGSLGKGGNSVGGVVAMMILLDVEQRASIVGGCAI